MIEQLESVVSLGWSVWRYRWLAVVTAWLVGLAAIVAVMLIPSQYEASARIYVDTQTILRPLMSGLTVQPNVEQQVSMLGRTLITRANVEKMAAMAGLDLSDGKTAKSERRLEEMTKALQIQSVGRDNLYQVSYRDKSAEQAKKVVDAMVSVFVQSSVGASRKDGDAAKSFIDEQIKAYQVKLEEAEAKLKEFRIRNIDTQTGDGRDAATRITELSTSLDAARLQLREAEQSRDAARAAMESERNGQSAAAALPDLLNGTSAPVATPELDARIDAQKRGLDTLLQRFTDQHPDVLAARRLIKDLEEQRLREVAALKARAASAPSPVRQSQATGLAYQELARVAATTDVQVAAARARVAEFTSRLEQARAKLKEAPRIEAEAAQLNRDYSVHRRAYEELVQRRESAAIYNKLDDAAGLAEFRVIEPARVPQKPAFPSRPLMLLAALAAALGAGFVAAFLKAQIKPVFHRPSELHSRLGLPLLGAVTILRSEADVRRQRWEFAGLSAASGSLVVLFALSVLVSAVLRV